MVFENDMVDVLYGYGAGINISATCCYFLNKTRLHNFQKLDVQPICSLLILGAQSIVRCDEIEWF